MADVSDTAREARLATSALRAGPYIGTAPTNPDAPQMYYASVAEKRNAILSKKAQAGEVRPRRVFRRRQLRRAALTRGNGARSGSGAWRPRRR